MGAPNERRRAPEPPAFRSAGTHFQFRNGWQVRLLPLEAVTTEVRYEVTIYDPDYHAVAFSGEAAASLKKLDSDSVVLILTAVRSFTASTKRVKTAEFIASLIALSL
jgi:hypothetical protein